MVNSKIEKKLGIVKDQVMGKAVSKTRIILETDEQKEQRELVGKIANNISALAKAVSSLLNGPLNKRALIILLASSASQPQYVVADVLQAIENLDEDWLNK